MVSKSRKSFMSGILLGVATSLFAVGIILIPNVVVANEMIPMLPVKTPCENCTGGCSGGDNTNGCGIASYHCNPSPGTSGCSTSTGTCGCDRVASPSKLCNCYP